MTIERHFLLDHLRRLIYIGRLYVDPKPDEPNPDGVPRPAGAVPDPRAVRPEGRRRARLPLPRSRRSRTTRWLYLPSLRRVRRLSTAQRSDALFGQDTDVDSYYGYAGHSAWMDWKLLGEKEMLGVLHAQNFPVKWADGQGDFAFDDVWEKRKVWVVEGIVEARRSTPTRSASSTSTRRRGSILVLRHLRSRRRPVEGVGQRLQLPQAGPRAATIQLRGRDGLRAGDRHGRHAARARHQGGAAEPALPGEKGWYFNQGEKSGTTDDFFTIAALIESAR